MSTLRAVILLILSLIPACLPAAETKVFIPRGSYVLSLAPHGKAMDQAMPFVAHVLNAGGRVLLPLPKDSEMLMGNSGVEERALKTLLGRQGPYYFLQQDKALIEAAKKAYPRVKLETLDGDVGPQIVCLSRGMPRLAVIENAASISPLSEGLKKNAWPYVPLDFARIEASAAGWMDARRYDFISLSSPGWWYNFADTPSGPSRMGDTVASALKSFVTGGGTAYFCDLAQWDLEKAWPGSIKLDSLGPMKSRLFNLGDSDKTVALYLAGFGTAPISLERATAFTLISAPKYAFPEGKPRKAYAAYGFKDPAGGSGMAFGQSFHTFEQDDSDSGGVAARNILMNLLVMSGTRRLSAWDGVGQPLGASTPVPTSAPTFIPPPTPMATQRKTEAAPRKTSTPAPTRVPTATLTATATALPTLRPTQVPTSLPKPTTEPTLVPPPTVMPTAVPTVRVGPPRSPTPVPTLKPTVETTKGKANKVLGCLQASPQPFGEGGVFIYFCLKSKAWVRLSIFDLQGHLLRVVKKSEEPAGNRQWFYDGKDEKGNQLPGGTYYYSLDAWGENIKDQSFDRIVKN